MRIRKRYLGGLVLVAVAGAGLAAFLGRVPGPPAANGDLRLVDAVQRQDKPAMPALLRQRGALNSAQPDGATALHWAVHWDDLDTTDQLLRAGARVDAKNDYGA